MPRMATEKGKAAFSFLLDFLKLRRKATFAECRDAAQARGHTIYSISFGRAQALLGIVKSAKRGTGKYAKAKTPEAKRASIGSRRPVAKVDDVGRRASVIDGVQELSRDHARLRGTLDKIQGILAKP